MVHDNGLYSILVTDSTNAKCRNQKIRSLAVLMAAAICSAPSIADQARPDVPLLSRELRAYASSGKAEAASDRDYNRLWRSSGVPATLSYDLSSLSAAQRTRLLVVWYNDPTYSYDHTLINGPGYNNPGSYTVEGNAAPGNSAPPDSGWVTLATVTGNTLHSREHLLDFAPYKWLRLNFSASDGSPHNSDIALKVDIYDGAHAGSDGWLFVGDSITAGGMAHSNFGGTRSESFGNQVSALIGSTPAQENAGIPGWTAQNAVSHMQAWLKSFPGRYVTIAFGSNEAAGATPAAGYRADMTTLIKDVLAVGKVPVIPTIPWSRDPTHAGNIPALNAQIRKLYSDNHCVVQGPDLFAFFQSHPEQISADNLHPTDEGFASLRALWARSAATISTTAQPADCPSVTAAH